MEKSWYSEDTFVSMFSLLPNPTPKRSHLTNMCMLFDVDFRCDNPRQCVLSSGADFWLEVKLTPDISLNQIYFYLDANE